MVDEPINYRASYQGFMRGFDVFVEWLTLPLFGGVNGRLEMEAPKVLSFEKHEQRSLEV